VAVPSPLPPHLASWLLSRGFSLGDWEQIPIAADAAADEFGDDVWHTVIDHGRWLVSLIGRALFAEIRPGLVGADQRLPFRKQRFVRVFQQAVCVDLRANRIPRVQECLALAADHRGAIEARLSDVGRSALIQLTALLERYLASALVRPRPDQMPQNGF